MKVGVIGLGVMGRNHARVYSELKGVDSLFAFDSDSSVLARVSNEYNAECCKSLFELTKNVDAVSICVPTQHHYKVMKQMVEWGVSFLVEKPICATNREALTILGNIQPELIAGVGHIERFNPIVDEIKKIIRRPLYIELKRHNPDSSRVFGSTVIEDLMIHDIDILFHSLIGGAWNIKSTGTADVCSALFNFQSTPVYLSASRKSSKKIRLIYIEEEEFTIEGDFMTQEIYVHRKPDQYQIKDGRYVQENIVEKVMVKKQEPLKQELSVFLDCVKSGKQFPVTLAQGLTNLEICEVIKKGII